MIGPEISEDKKLSIAHCKKVLCSDGSTYTDEEVRMIRDFLYQMASIEYHIYTQDKNHEKERNFIHKGVH